LTRNYKPYIPVPILDKECHNRGFNARKFIEC
jgi:hypothetical protein